MSDIAIRVEDLSKIYRIGRNEQRHDTMSGAFASFFRSPLKNFRQLTRLTRFDSVEDDDIVWALKDVGFEVKRGETMGIIGRNGAGKSTLLKILSRITQPTRGRAEVFGRVASLLEVGTGFHPDLTGRENIYLNGTILGMRKHEIDSRFDEIVDFSGVEKFIDTPVKRYSSGMRMRLAFSVAAHLEPEIIIVDEVLAVGDAEFQKKCLGKMGEVAGHGRTVLFVSHNMAAVRTLCTRGLVLEHGAVSFSGKIEEAIHRYGGAGTLPGSSVEAGRSALADVEIKGSASSSVGGGEPFDVRCRLTLPSAITAFRLVCVIKDCEGGTAIHAATDSRQFDGLAGQGSYEVTAGFPSLWLTPGVYAVYFKVFANAVDLSSAKYQSETVMLDFAGQVQPHSLEMGYLSPDVKWTIRQ